LRLGGAPHTFLLCFFAKRVCQTRYRYGLFFDIAPNSYYCLALQRLNHGQLTTNASHLVIVFFNRKQADAFLDRAVEKYQICRKLAGFEHTQGACFHYHIKSCLGACIGKETAEEYNKRVIKLLNHFNYEEESFVILNDGRTA
jgi:DNA polymerase-3 subunit epsilon